ncbi:hypothetical protein OY671_009417, partial [Metschnikowia pulcherrima]
PAQHHGDADSQRGGAAVAGGHVRHHVPGRFLHQQPDADGADHRHRLRGGRRHRPDREHRPPHRRGRDAAAGPAQGRLADRLHADLADLLADRGADPAAVHDRGGGAAVPRVRHHAGGVDPDLAGGVADADADDVRAPVARRVRAEARPLPPGHRGLHRPHHRRLRPHAAEGAAAPAADAAGGAGDLRADGAAVHPDSQGLLPAAGHRADPG